MMEWIISASVLIILVIISRKLLKGKISCWVQYSLWLLVAVRLLVPVSPMESAFSIANLLPESWTGGQTGGDSTWVSRRAEPEKGGISRQEKMPDSPAPGMAVPAAPYSAEDESLLKVSISLAEKKADSLSESDVRDKTALIGPAIGTMWLAGSCLLALWLSGVNGIFRWRVRRNRLLLSLPGDLQSRLPVYVTDEIKTPCMYGLLRPAIYITARTAENLQVLDMVLRHEQMHYRHGDNIWSMVRMLCLCLHWYNPLVWAAVVLSRQDGELACDEGVLRQVGEGKRRIYGEALLTLSTEHKPTLRGSLNLATSMSGTGKQLKERLSFLVTRPRMAAGTAVLVFLLALGLMACTLTGRADAHEEKAVSDRTEISKPPQSKGTEPEREKESGQVAEAEEEKESGGGQGTEPEEGKEPDGGQGTEPEEGKESGGGLETGSGDDEKPGEGQETETEVLDYRMSWVLAEEYTGYLDEVDAWKQVYQNQDYDGDGLTDRIYQEVVGHGSTAGARKMRVEFGNGEILSFDVFQNSALMVQSLDMDGDGSRELLFTTPNDFSTNPPSIGSDILLFTRQGDGYRQVEIALEEAPQEYGPTPWEVYLITSYSKEDDSHIRVSWRVHGAEDNFGETQAGLCSMDEEEMAYYEAFLGGWNHEPAYSAELIQEKDAFLRLYFEGLFRSGDEIWVDMLLENGRLFPVSSSYVDVNWNEEDRSAGYEIVNMDPAEAAAVYDGWNARIREYYDAEENPVAEVTEGDVTRKLTFVETSWSLSAAETQVSHEVLYWACQALLELEQWTGTRVTEVCYTVSEFGDFSFGLTPEDMVHDRTFYSRCYNGLSFIRGEVIESIYYSTDMDVWYSPVKQYTTPPRYDKMTTEERLIWYFERSAIARGSKVEEVIYPWEGNDYLFRTDQGTYYDFAATEGIDTLGKGLYLAGPYEGYPQH